MGMSAFYFFSLGVMALPVLAFYTGSWRLLYVVTSIPAVIYCAIILPFVCKSPARWYVIQGRLEEAMAVLRNFATLNGKSSVPSWVSLTTDHELVDHVETTALFAAAAVNLPNSESHDSAAAAVVHELPRNSCKLDHN
jgi:OCT family organic cation transporter-like MFS transporter 4/5